MKKAFRVATLLASIALGIAAGGSASAFTFEMGAGSSIDTSSTNGVLRLDVVRINPDLADLAFNLEVGQTRDIYFATIGTTESWIHRDDRRPGAVTAFLDFDSPDHTLSIGGTSVGFSALWHFLQGWNLEWDDPIRVVTASGIDFSVDLSNVDSLSWFWRGPDGTADIHAKVTLNAAPVPVPAPLLLLGSGVVGLMVMKKRAKRTAC